MYVGGWVVRGDVYVPRRWCWRHASCMAMACALRRACTHAPARMHARARTWGVQVHVPSVALRPRPRSHPSPKRHTRLTCEPLVLGPLLAMDRIPRLECLSPSTSSSGNLPLAVLYMLLPPLPVPVGSPASAGATARWDRRLAALRTSGPARYGGGGGTRGGTVAVYLRASGGGGGLTPPTPLPPPQPNTRRPSPHTQWAPHTQSATPLAHLLES